MGSPHHHWPSSLCVLYQAKWTCRRPLPQSRIWASCGGRCRAGWRGSKSGGRGSRGSWRRWARKEIEAKQCALEMVEANERQMAGQGPGRPKVDEGGSGPSSQVNGSTKLQGIATSPFGLTWAPVCACCDSPRRQRLLASGPVPSLLRSSRSLSPLPRSSSSPRGVGGPPTAGADVQGGGAIRLHMQGAGGGGTRALSWGPRYDEDRQAAGGADDLPKGAIGGFWRCPPPLRSRTEGGAGGVALRGRAWEARHGNDNDAQ
jgi:hypothetical protein